MWGHPLHSPRQQSRQSLRGCIACIYIIPCGSLSVSMSVVSSSFSFRVLACSSVGALLGIGRMCGYTKAGTSTGMIPSGRCRQALPCTSPHRCSRPGKLREGTKAPRQTIGTRGGPSRTRGGSKGPCPSVQGDRFVVGSASSNVEASSIAPFLQPLLSPPFMWWGEENGGDCPIPTASPLPSLRLKGLKARLQV